MEQTGGSQITAYAVSWDQGLGGAFIELSSSLETDLVYVLDIVTGVYYKFKYRAINIYGDGQDSDEITILAATAPSEMA